MLGFGRHGELTSCHLNRHMALNACSVLSSGMDGTEDDLAWALGAGNRVGSGNEIKGGVEVNRAQPLFLLLL